MEIKITLLDHLTGVFLVKLRPTIKNTAANDKTFLRDENHQCGGSLRRKKSRVSFVDDSYDDPEITHPTISDKRQELHFTSAPNRKTSNNFEASIKHLHNL